MKALLDAVAAVVCLVSPEKVHAISSRVRQTNVGKAAAAIAKPSMAGWFVGQVMKATGGKANPATVNALLKARLGLPDEG